MEEPTFTKSRTAREEPIRAIPYTDTELPNRTKLRKEIEEPR
jgi:hypothetical protein